MSQILSRFFTFSVMLFLSLSVLHPLKIGVFSDIRREGFMFVCWPMVSGQGFLASFKTWKRTQVSSVHFKMLILSLEVHLPPATSQPCQVLSGSVSAFSLNSSWRWLEGHMYEPSVMLLNTPWAKLKSPLWWRRLPWVGVSKNISEAPCQVSCYSAYFSKVTNTSWHCWNINEVICLNHFDSDLGRIWKTNKGVL